MTAKEWKDSLYGGSISEHTVQAILDDGRVQGMREAADWIEHVFDQGADGCASAIRKRADKLAKGEK